jgi:hypothetical protein
MKPSLGWTFWSRADIRRIDKQLKAGAQEVRDELGFLLLHQGFADRFFPGTSVLQTRLRYVLFVPWIYKKVHAERRGRDIERQISVEQVNLARRLKMTERVDVIGGDKVPEAAMQPPDHVYWNALRTWGILRPNAWGGPRKRADVLRWVATVALRKSELDDDGAPLVEEDTPFAGIPQPPDKWLREDEPLHFRLATHERRDLRAKLSIIARPGLDGGDSLFARLARSDVNPKLCDWPWSPPVMDLADEADREALRLARYASALAVIGRGVYAAMMEDLRERDRVCDDRRHRDNLPALLEQHGARALRLNFELLPRFVPHLPAYFENLLRETQEWIKHTNGRDWSVLHNVYARAEVTRKGVMRARLYSLPESAERRRMWEYEKYQALELHYRWYRVQRLLADLQGLP